MTYAGASSFGCPGLCIGTCLPKFFTFWGAIVEGISGVQIGPGATQLARMPFSASSCASPPVKFTIAALVAEYASSFGRGESDTTDAVLTIAAPGFMCAIAALQRWNIA